MEKITIEYQPYPLLKYMRKIEGSFPSTFSELTAIQFIAIARFINLKIYETIFLEYMTGIKGYGINRLNNYSRYQLMQLFEPFTAVTPYNTFIIQSLKTSGGTLQSPRPQLASMTFGQFIFIESYFESFQTDKEPINLYKFVASLYLHSWAKFNEDEINPGALLTAKVKQEILDAIVINYVLVKEWLSIIYPLIFQREEAVEETEKPKTHKNPKNNNAWLKIFESIVGDDIINNDRYSKLYLHDVLRWMTRKIKENLRAK